MPNWKDGAAKRLIPLWSPFQHARPARGVGEAASHPTGDRRASPNLRAWAHETSLQAQPGCCMGRMPHFCWAAKQHSDLGLFTLHLPPTPWGPGVPHRRPTGDRRASPNPRAGAAPLHGWRNHDTCAKSALPSTLRDDEAAKLNPPMSSNSCHVEEGISSGPGRACGAWRISCAGCHSFVAA